MAIESSQIPLVDTLSDNCSKPTILQRRLSLVFGLNLCCKINKQANFIIINMSKYVHGARFSLIKIKHLSEQTTSGRFTYTSMQNLF